VWEKSGLGGGKGRVKGQGGECSVGEDVRKAMLRSGPTSRHKGSQEAAMWQSAEGDVTMTNRPNAGPHALCWETHWSEWRELSSATKVNHFCTRPGTFSSKKWPCSGIFLGENSVPKAKPTHVLTHVVFQTDHGLHNWLAHTVPPCLYSHEWFRHLVSLAANTHAFILTIISPEHSLLGARPP
jgi:hypothetical protein